MDDEKANVRSDGAYAGEGGDISGSRAPRIRDWWWIFAASSSPKSSCFRSAYGKHEALQIMRRDSKRMFDPKLFGVFEDMMKRGNFDR